MRLFEARVTYLKNSNVVDDNMNGKHLFCKPKLKNRTMRKLLLFVLCAGMVTACKQEENTSGEVRSKLLQSASESDESYDDGTTTLAFDKMEHDFGNVKIGQDYTYKFKVTNTGKKPLVIEDAKASCGCTVPAKPEKPIEPGKSDEIVVTFSPKAGQGGMNSKTVTVTANTDPKLTTLTIKANVIEDMSQSGAKPVM